MKLPDQNLRELLGYCLKRAHVLVEAAANRVLERFGLRRVSFSALGVIVQSPGLSQAQLAETLAIEKSNLVAIVDELEQSALITRTRSPEDRRAYQLHPTVHGYHLYWDAHKSVLAEEANIMHDLGRTEQETLVSMLGQIECNALEQSDEHNGQKTASR